MAKISKWMAVLTGIVTSVFASSCARNAEQAQQDSITTIYGPPEMLNPSEPATDNNNEALDQPQHELPMPEPEFAKPIYGPSEMLRDDPMTPVDKNIDVQTLPQPELRDIDIDTPENTSEKIETYKKITDLPAKKIYGPPPAKKIRGTVLNERKLDGKDTAKGSNVDPDDEEKVDDFGDRVLPRKGPGEIRALYGVVAPPINIKK